MEMYNKINVEKDKMWDKLLSLSPVASEKTW